MLTQKQLGEELKTLSTKPFDGFKIARWAKHISTIHCRELSSELHDIILALSAMQHGPEFE